MFRFFFFQAEDGIRDLVRSRGLGDVYKRQVRGGGECRDEKEQESEGSGMHGQNEMGKEGEKVGLSLIHI
mgnify:CR=1 FL=1